MYIGDSKIISVEYLLKRRKEFYEFGAKVMYDRFQERQERVKEGIQKEVANQIEGGEVDGEE